MRRCKPWYVTRSVSVSDSASSDAAVTVWVASNHVSTNRSDSLGDSIDSRGR